MTEIEHYMVKCSDLSDRVAELEASIARGKQFIRGMYEIATIRGMGIDQELAECIDEEAWSAGISYEQVVGRALRYYFYGERDR